MFVSIAWPPWIVFGWCLPCSTHWMKELTSQAASHQPAGFGSMKCMWSHESHCSPMQALSNAKVLCCGCLPDPREPGRDTVCIADIHTYLIDTLTQSCLGNKVPSTDQQTRSLKKVLGDLEPGSTTVKNNNITKYMFIVLPSFWSHFIQIFYLIVALMPVIAFCTLDYGCPFTSLIPALSCHIPQTYVHFLSTVISSARGSAICKQFINMDWQMRSVGN